MAEATIVLTLVATSIGQAFRLDNLISKLPSIRSEPSLSKRLASSSDFHRIGVPPEAISPLPEVLGREMLRPPLVRGACFMQAGGESVRCGWVVPTLRRQARLRLRSTASRLDPDTR